ncbi:MAG: type II toxin-antitoxin system RelE/ParE family toxin [Propionibacteriaceae bacterium]|nr:type II toxin-antitoxin system RelE/ParE family toxin [Propionibacteriaceae bacterium]
MNVRFFRRFVKQLAKLPRSVQASTYARIELMMVNPDDPILRRRRLKGALRHLWSIDITGDVRALYEIVDGQVIVYQFVGSRSQLYG